MAVSFAGALVIGLATSREGPESALGDGAESALGVLLCLLAAFGYASGVVAQKPALRHVSALQVTTFSCMVGAVACLPFAGQLVADMGAAPVSATLEMVYLGLFPTALAFYTWAYALSRTTAGKMGATTYVVPALVVLMSWIFLDEIPGLVTLAGGALCLVGVAVARSRKRARAVLTPGGSSL
jgi:drug/metabolite transporter (DMT)-like permease